MRESIHFCGSRWGDSASIEIVSRHVKLPYVSIINVVSVFPISREGDSRIICICAYIDHPPARERSARSCMNPGLSYACVHARTRFCGCIPCTMIVLVSVSAFIHYIFAHKIFLKKKVTRTHLWLPPPPNASFTTS